MSLKSNALGILLLAGCASLPGFSLTDAIRELLSGHTF